jgi:hypothetical protein
MWSRNLREHFWAVLHMYRALPVGPALQIQSTTVRRAMPRSNFGDVIANGPGVACVKRGWGAESTTRVTSEPGSQAVTRHESGGAGV